MTLKQLIKDYEKRIDTVSFLITKAEDEETLKRLRIKRGCFRTFLTELKRIKK